MVEAYFFVAAPADVVELRSLASVPDDDLVDLVRLPGAEALEALCAILGGSDARKGLREMPGGPRGAATVYELGRPLEAALLTAADDELRRGGARWATLPPWSALAANVYDLSETVVTLTENYRAAADPAKRLFAWIEPSPR